MVKLGRPFKGLVDADGRECSKCGEYKEWKQFPKLDDRLPSACLVCCRPEKKIPDEQKLEAKKLRDEFSLEYPCWQGMKQRCLNDRNPGYKNYGGRGIRICQRLLSFKGFTQILGKRPEGFTLDRIENDKHYSCGACKQCLANGWILNVRWATWIVQANNRRFRSFVTAMERSTAPI